MALSNSANSRLSFILLQADCDSFFCRRLDTAATATATQAFHARPINCRIFRISVETCSIYSVAAGVEKKPDVLTAEERLGS